MSITLLKNLSYTKIPIFCLFVIRHFIKWSRLFVLLRKAAGSPLSSAQNITK